jgi:hypothetical protein
MPPFKKGGIFIYTYFKKLKLPYFVTKMSCSDHQTNAKKQTLLLLKKLRFEAKMSELAF